MSGGWIALIVVIALVVIIGGWLWATYNGLVTLRVRVDEAWSDITVQLKRRADLIPNIIDTVKGYATHEREVFERVTSARSETISAGGPEQAAVAESHLQGALKSLFAVAEAYPDLKADASFRQLQGELTNVEEHVQLARRYYNGAARDLNIAVESFPNNLVAGAFGFQTVEYFELEDAADRAVPDVSFK